MTAFDWAFFVLEEHPYGREMLARLLDAGFVPRAIVEERSKISDEEREKFLVRIAGFEIPPTFTALLEGRDVERVVVPHHNGPEAQAFLEARPPDLLVLGGTRILRKRVYGLARDGAINAHPGLLPDVRGSASVAWAIHLDEPVGCTTHFLDDGIDTGGLIQRRRIDVLRGDTYEKLCRETLRVSAELMVEALTAYASGTLTGTPQGEGRPAFSNMPDDEVEAVKRKLAEGTYRHFVD